MILAAFGFLNFSLWDVLDILFVAVLIFLVLSWLRGSTAWSIFIAIVALIVISAVASALEMNLTAKIMGTIVDVGVIALIVIFQPEIRRFLARFGSRTIANMGKTGLFGNLFKNMKRSPTNSDAVNEVTEACIRMSEGLTGALIVIAHRDAMDEIIQTGDRLDAIIHRRLIMNVFFKNSPLHDGAMILGDNRIVAARCTLPITEKTDIPPDFGMRHKAAIGITESTDADAVVVSEETGKISFVKAGKAVAVNSINELQLLLSESMA